MKRLRIGHPTYTLALSNGAYALTGKDVTLTASTAAAYPDATNTGVPSGTTLTTTSGTITSSANNQVIQDLDLAGVILVGHSGVIIRRCRITVPWGENGVANTSSAAADLIVEDCEIVGVAYAPNGWGYNGINFEYGGTALRCNIHKFENCIFYSSAGTGGLTEDCYLHDSYPYSLWDGHTGGGDGPHVDTLQLWGGQLNLTIRHNTILADLFASACFTCGSNSTNLLIENNLFQGGFYCFRIGESGSCGTNVQIINNKFSQALDTNVGDVGLWSVGTNSGRSGNTYYESGLPVSDGA